MSEFLAIKIRKQTAICSAITKDKIDSHCVIPCNIAESAVKIASEWRCAILVYAVQDTILITCAAMAFFL